MRIIGKPTAEVLDGLLGTAEMTGRSRIVPETFPQAVDRVYVRCGLRV